MNDPGLNDLLKWSIENSSASLSSQPQQPEQDQAQGAHTHHQPPRSLNPAALNTLLGGPSDADLMRHALSVVLSSPTPDDDTPASKILENKLTAFDNLEQLIENIDNANNLEPLGMWTPLVGVLGDEEGELRLMAAWCVGTAVQNNEKAQERFLVVGGIPKLVEMAIGDTHNAAKKKSIYALSSAVRNFQPALDEAVKHLPKEFVPSSGKVDAGDMDVIDEIMSKLRSHTPADAAA